MPLFPLAIPPGIVRAGTEYQSRSRWFDASLVRFWNGTIQPVGGWETVNAAALTGRPCALFAWRPNSSNIGRFLFVGTEQKAYAYDGAVVTDITPTFFDVGVATATSSEGYGAGAYGSEEYGTPRTGTGGITKVDAWHADAWGENLLTVYSADGRICEWGLNTANDLVVVANAPINCRGLVVTDERIVMALGADGDRRAVAWSDSEDNTTWAPTNSNFAGDFLLTTDGEIITAERVRGGVLIHTTTDAHLASFIGQPLVYSFNRVGDNCGIVSANAKVSAAGFVVWMGNNGFYMFDGYVKPLPCDVQDYVFTNINRVQFSKVAAWHNGEWGEIWFFYAATGSNENNRYVVWNYREGHWTIGALARTAGIDKGVWNYPIAVDATGFWHYHEYGYTNDGAERTSAVFLESGPTEIAPGDRLVWLNQCIHDESDGTDKLRLELKTKFTPEGTEYTAGPYTLDAANGYTDVRAQGRAFKVRLEEVSSGQWKLGTLRFDVRQAGRR